MTCIVGLAENGVVYMGGDSCAGNDWMVDSVKNRKVFKTGEFLIGLATSWRMGQLLEHNLNVRPQGAGTDLAYLVKVFVEAVRTCLKDGGFAEIENGKESGGTFLVGYKDKVYEFQADFSILEPSSGIAACGHGHLQALAVMQALEDKPPEERIMKALDIAACTSQYVKPPFHILKMGEEAEAGDKTE